MVLPLVILFLLGAMQGAIGWIMVKSGLNDSDLYVSHIRLAIHFVSAMILIAYALVFGLKIITPKKDFVEQPLLNKTAIAILVLITIQLVYGAFMAGLKAAPAAATWPDINGVMVPDNMKEGSFLNSISHNKIAIHFIHRTMAYVIVILVGLWWWAAKSITYSNSFNKVKYLPLLLVIAQTVLGILTVLNSRVMNPGGFGLFEWFAQLHQLFGMLLFLSMIAVVYFTKGKRSYQ
jgi:cytochrome c oxidase assembly protein subunit 15